MTTVAVTGATGFIGGSLVSHLHSRGYEVFAFGRRADAPFPLEVRYTAWDITNPATDVAGDVDVVIHCAGSVSDWGDYEDVYAANVTGTVNVLSAFSAARQFIYVSTASVYDPFVPKVNVREDASPARRYLNAYGTTKALAEQAVLRSSNNNRVVVRPHAVYGPGDTTLLPRLLRARKLGHFLVLGDGRNQVSVTNIHNLCEAVELMLDRDLDGEIFNIVDAESDSIGHILSTFVDTLGLDVPLLHIPVRVATSLARSLEVVCRVRRCHTPPFITVYAVNQLTSEFTLDIGKARRMLGYDPRHDYREGFQEIRTWLDHGVAGDGFTSSLR